MLKTCFQVLCVLCVILQHKSVSPKGMKRERHENVIQADIPLAWSNLKETEPGFNLSPKEIAKFKLWPAGIIPFYMDRVSFDKELLARLRTYLTEISSMTSLEFDELPVPPEDPTFRYVFFINRRGALECVDYTSRNFSYTGVQKVVMGYDCFSGGDLGALILALVGVPPQHNSPDRDSYIRVQEDNILPDKKHLFTMLSNEEWLFHDVDYDILSAGHYDFHKYTLNGAATIVPLHPVSFSVGEGGGLSYTDLWKMRMLYNRIIRKKDLKRTKLAKRLCRKMFKPGKAFDRFSPDSADSEEEPRLKPLKYSDNQTSRNGVPAAQKMRLNLKRNPKQIKPPYFKTRNVFGQDDNVKSDPLHDRSDYISCSDKK